MFDESVLPDTRHFFEDIISKLSVFMAQQGTPTVGKYFFKFILIFLIGFSMVNH